MKKLLLVLLFLPFAVWAQIQRVEPMSWWTGFSDPQLQLLVYGKGISDAQVRLDYPGVRLKKINKVENPNYLFLDLEVGEDAKPGRFKIDFSRNGKTFYRYDYVLNARSKGLTRNQGVTEKDLIYLIMPDRFANGDYKNDVVRSMRENTINRDSMYYRHGGDLQGIINKLPYLKDLGVTAIWNTPEVENDMDNASYHGYAATDLYKIDPRYGTNELYRQYVEAAHRHGLKIIKDVVPNHVGTEHWFIQDMPMKDWVNRFPVYTNTSYRFEPVQDPYASEIDYNEAVRGWFVPTMADLNQENPYVQKYLTQNYLWWTEYAGIDGFRIDTYSYNDPKFMAEWVKRVRTEFPRVSIFGETLMFQASNQAYFTEGDRVGRGLDTHLPGITDSVLKDALYEALNGKYGWYDGVNRLYNALAQDYLYEHPENNVLFLDNHDMSRFFSMVGEDLTKFKSGITLLFTLKKVPQMYYGTEILMKNFSDPDGLVRSDMPGGWKADKVDKFTAAGRTAQENEAFDFIKTLANFRKNSSALTAGKMMQFFPKDGLYVYFRYDGEQTIMVAYNGAEEMRKLNPLRYRERLGNSSTAVDIISGKIVGLNNLQLQPRQSLILEIK
ncbi:MAG: alpha-amylase [Chryseobacterium sp.]|nr:MAG: alpha-amylase [Chryseobacterium sp.]